MDKLEEFKSEAVNLRIVTDKYTLIIDGTYLHEDKYTHKYMDSYGTVMSFQKDKMVYVEEETNLRPEHDGCREFEIFLSNKESISIIGVPLLDQDTDNWEYYLSKYGQKYHIRRGKIEYVVGL